jgi:hypothetical protein
MKQKLTENELKGVIYARVKRLLESLDGDDKVVSAFILQPQYTNFIKTACHIIAWKGIDFDLNIRGNDYKVAKHMIDSYIAAKQTAMKSSNPKENVARVKDAWRKKSGCEGLVDSEKEAFERFTQFKEEGYDFISRYLGNKNNSSKQMEKAAGLALFGDKSDLSEFHIMHGAVFCVRDFFRWVNAGKPDFDRTKTGKLKAGDSPLRKAGITGRIINTNDLDGDPGVEDSGNELWRDVKALLDDRTKDSIEIAKAIVGGSVREKQEDFKEVLMNINEYRKLIVGSKQNSDAFRTSAYDALDKLTEKIKELRAESVVSQLLSGQEPEGEDEELNEGRQPDDSPLHNEEKSQLVENSRRIKILLAETYDLADKINDQRSKAIFGKILEFLLKSERDPRAVEAMRKAGRMTDDED